MKHLVFLFVVLVGWSCSKKVVPISDSVTIINSDSTHVEDKFTPDTVRIAGDTVRLVKVIECDEKTNKPVPFAAKLKSGRESVGLTLNSKGELNVAGICDSLNRVIQVKSETIYRLRKELSVKQTTSVQFITRKIDLYCRWFSGIVLALCVGYGAAKLKSLFI